MTTQTLYVTPPQSYWGTGVTGNVLPDGINDSTDTITHNSAVGIKVVDATTLAAALDVNGAEVLRGLTLANFAANAAIGTAVATVDAFSTVLIPQTTANITLTIPNPTNTQSGRRLIIGNTGTSSITVGGTVIGANQLSQFVWSGTTWLNIAFPPSVDFWRSGAGTILPDGTLDTSENIAHAGNVGINNANPSTVASALDVTGSVIFRPVNLANFAANAVIGTAATTVDIASTINIPQTTAGITVTIPAPTINVAGRMLLVNNTGNTNITVGGKVIAPATGILYSWSGTAWIPYVQAATLGSIDAHTDVDTTTVAPTIGQTLIWNGVNWVPGASTAAPTIQRTTTAASTTIQPFPLVNTVGLAPTNATFTNPSATRSMTLLITFKFGEMLYRFNLNEVFNIAMRGNCWVNGVRVNPPADHDRRCAVNTANAGGGQLEYTTGTKDYDHTMTLAAGATVTLMQDYDYNINVAPIGGNGGRILCEPSTIVVVGFLN